MKLNFETLKTNFFSYLLDSGKLKKEDVDKVDSDTISIFKYANEFKNYIKTELPDNEDVKSLTITEILNMDIIDKQLTESAPEEDIDINSLDDSEDMESLDQDCDTENIENSDETELSEEDIVVQIFNEFLNNDEFFVFMDKDGNQEISKEEQSMFLDLIKNYDGSEDDISLDDLITSAIAIKEGKLQDQNLQDNKLEEVNTTDTDKTDTDTDTDTDNTAAKDKETQKSSSSGGGGGGVDTSGSSAPPPAASADNATKTIDNMTKEELQAELDKVVSQISEKDTQITEQERNIADSEQVLADLNVQYTDISSTINTLESELNTLNSTDTSNLTPEQLSDLNSKIELTKSQLLEAQNKAAEITEKIKAEEEKLNEYKNTLNELKAAKDELVKQKEEIEAKIAKKLESSLSLDIDFDEKITGYEMKKFSYNGRNYWACVPQGIELNEETPMVIYFHGFGGRSSNASSLTGDNMYNSLNEMAKSSVYKSPKCIFLYPQAHSSSCWDDENEMAWVDAIANDFINNSGYKIDRDRISLMGYSNGGGGAPLYYTYSGRTIKISKVAVLAGYFYRKYPDKFNRMVKELGSNLRVYTGTSDANKNPHYFHDDAKAAGLSDENNIELSNVGHGGTPKAALYRDGQDDAQNGRSDLFEFLLSL